MDEKELMLAIRKLREHMGLNQTDFARQIFDRTLPTQQRYETVRPPSGVNLVPLVRAARAHGRHDLANLFKEAPSSLFLPRFET